MPQRPKFKPTRGRVDMERLMNMTDEEIERTAPEELPFLPDSFWKNARVVYPPGKHAISLRVDADVLNYFRAGGPRYQTRMNAVLRSYVQEMHCPARRKSVRMSGSAKRR